MSIEQAEPLWEPPRYRKERPDDRALLVSDGKRAHVLCHIGPALDYWIYELGDPEAWDGTPAGVWIWEGTLRTGKYWTDYGYEYDCDLDGTERALTDAEWDSLRSGEDLWDAAEWLGRESA